MTSTGVAPQPIESPLFPYLSFGQNGTKVIVGTAHAFRRVLMIMDTLFERNGLHILYRWGHSEDCHFPLFPQMKVPNFSTIAAVYSVMLAGAIGVTLGYKFRVSTLFFGIPYWYLILLDKTYWNNHSYLFGLVIILLSGSSANHSASIDSLCDAKLNNRPVPFWNYFILRFQFFILYFMAGLKKIDAEWLYGYSMDDMGDHWVFQPFKLFLTTSQIDYFVVHLIGFIIDLTMGFWLISPISRPYAMFFCAYFHVLNSRLFSIGMFPYVCIATMPIFCKEDWPQNLLRRFRFRVNPRSEASNRKKIAGLNLKKRIVASLLLLHCAIQFFLPYSHGITKGFNNWTNGLYGYSWDMMVHSWNSALVVVRITDNENERDYFIDPEIWTQNQRWNKHADMCIQYAQCLKENLLQIKQGSFESEWKNLSSNISVYIDVWCSLNGRFQQRMFNPNYDLLKAKWSAFTKVEWLLPLMAESGEFRSQLPKIEDHVYSWSNYSEVMFVADFPDMVLENYLSVDLTNVTLTVLSGEVIYEMENDREIYVKLPKGSYHKIRTGKFHKIHTYGREPSLYMYTFINKTKEKLNEH